MKTLLIGLLASTFATPALAQHAGHQSAPAPQQQPAASTASPADPSCPPEHAAMGHCTPKAAPTQAPAAQAPATGVQSQAQPAPTCTAEHAAMGHCVMPAGQPGQAMASPSASQKDPHAGHSMPEAPTATNKTTDPHAGHVMPAAPAAPAGQQQSADPHAGHTMPSAQPAPAADPHAGHNMPAAPGAAPLPPATPPPPIAFSGPEHAADLYFGDAAMVDARQELIEEHGDIAVYKVWLDQLEARFHDGPNSYEWDAQAWYGGDINKIWFKTEGEGAFKGGIESSEVQALWSRAIDPWFDVQLGVRQDFRPGPNRTYLVAGIQGLAPYWFEVEGTAFVSNKGDVTARFEGEYDLRITQNLILQPRVELDLAAQDIPELGIGSGLSTGELGFRLRYQLYPSSGPASIAPYIGVKYERAFGDTARFSRAEGEDVGGLAFLLGIRTWF